MSIGGKLFHGMAWTAIEKISIQVVGFILNIILARILSPKEYGIIGILIVFIAISQVFIDSGFTKALIQKQNRTADDISTVFLFNIAISIVCYLILWLIAPLIETFYQTEQLSLLLRILAITLIINALYAVPVTLYTIELDFKKLTKINFLATLASGLIAIYLAYSGFGVWSLVIQTILRSLFTACSVWYISDWYPKRKFSKVSFRELFSYGSNLLVSSLLNVTINKSYDLIIAKTNSLGDLGFYSRGAQFSDFVFGIINSVLERTLLPSLAQIQDQLQILVKQTRSIIRSTAIIVVPLFVFLALIAEPLIQVLLTDKWLPAVPIMQIFCIARAITIISGINVNLLYVIGRTDLALRQQYVKLGIRIIFLIIAINYGIIFIALAELASTLVHFFINTYYPGKIMKYGAISQLKDIQPILFATFIMTILVFLSIYYLENNWIKLVVAPLVSLPVYFGIIYFLKVKELFLILSNLKNFLHK